MRRAGGPERVESGQLGDLDRAGLLTLPPLCPGHHHVGRTGADERLAPVGDGRLGAVAPGHLGGMGLDPVAARLHHTISRTRAAAAFPSVIGGPGGGFHRCAEGSPRFVFSLRAKFASLTIP